MKENIPTTSSVPATWDEGCDEMRLAVEGLRSGAEDASKLIARLIQGAVAASYSRELVFLNPGSSIGGKPRLDDTGHADQRYLKAKSKAVVRDTEQVQKSVCEALKSGERQKVDQVLRDLIAESVEQTQIDWYQKSSDEHYKTVKRLTVDRTLEALFQELGF